MVVVVQLKGMLSIGNTGAGRVTVTSIVAFGFCYGCDSIAICTSVLNFERERIIKKITFIFSTGVVGCLMGQLGCVLGKGEVAIIDSDHHGGGVLGANSYSSSHRQVYHRRSTTGYY